MEPAKPLLYDEVPSCSRESDSPTKDKLFDPSIDMLVNDFDDERTLEEEEAMAAGEANDPTMELSNLEKEGNMPLEELLALYGYNSKENESSGGGDSEDEDIEEEEVEEDNEGEPQPLEQEEVCEPIVEKPPNSPRESKLSLLYEPIADEADDGRSMTTVSKLTDDEEDEGESNLEDDDYQKFGEAIHNIMVGTDYQAQVPDGLTHYDQVPANDREDKLLWDPSEAYSQQVEDYLRKVHEIIKPPIPKGDVLRDDEEALYLLQECGHDADEALSKLRMRDPSTVKVTNGNESKWSEEECRNFESGVRTYGKDFLQIQQNKVQTRTVAELVQFYYLWKKTERHDVFANKCRLDKKKYSFHPGFTILMDRFLDDQDSDTKSVISSSSAPSTT